MKRRADTSAQLLPQHVPKPISINGLLRCVDCHNDDARDFVEDFRCGDLVCTRCGAVVPGQVTYVHQFVDEDHNEYVCVPLGVATRVAPKRPKPLSSPYQRIYHYAELMASYYDRDPLIDEDVLDMVLVQVRTRAERLGYCLRDYVPRLCSEDIHEICRSIGDAKRQPYKCFGERFVKIKRWLSRKVGVNMVPDYWAPIEIAERMKNDFKLMNEAFDATLYVSGRKLTQKDGMLALGSSNNKHARRHNMPKYNFVIRELLWRNAQHIYDQCEVDFFFPLPRTPKVLAKLVKMYNIMAGQCGFGLSMWTGYDTIRVPKWNYDEYKQRWPYPYVKREITIYEWQGGMATKQQMADACEYNNTKSVSDNVQWIKC